MKNYLFTMLAFALVSCSAGYSAIVWTNTAGGNWSDATSWNPNQVPGTGDDAAITNNGTYVVTLDTSPIVNSLMLGGGSGTQTLDTGVNGLTLNNASTVKVHGVLELDAGLLSGGGFLTIGGKLDWTGGRIDTNIVMAIATNGVMVVNAGVSGNYLDFSGVLTNSGTIVLTNGGIRCIDYNFDGGGYGLLVNAPGGTIDLQDGSIIAFYNDNNGVGTPAVINYGTVRKSSGSDTNLINAPFYNFGKLDAQLGTVSLNGGGSGSGVFQADAGATLAFANDYEVDGALTGAGANSITHGKFVLNGSFNTPNVVLAGDAVLGGTNCVIADQFTWNSSARIDAGSVLTVATNGLMVVNAGGSGNYLDFSGVLTNSGTIVLTNGGIRCIDYNFDGGGYGLLVNAPGGTIDLQDGSIIAFYNDNSGVGTPTVINYGTVRKSSGSDTNLINAPFFNFGKLDAQLGTVSLNGGGSGSGVFQAEPGATVDYPASYEIDGIIAGQGTNLLDGGILTFNGTITGQFVWNSGRIGATSVGAVATNGLMVVDTGGIFGEVDFSGVLTNSGTIVLTNGGIRCIVYNSEDGGYGLVVNAPGGTIDLQDGSIIDYYNDNSGIGTPAVVNYGTVRKSSGSDTNLINAPFFNLGTLDAQTGVISLNGSYDLTGGTLNFGLNSPTEFGQIILSGSPTLTGTLSANLNRGFVATRGDYFGVLNYASQSGNFNNFILPVREAWSTNYGNTTFTLTVLNSAPVLPNQTNRVMNEETLLTVTNTATDLDLPPDTLTYSLLTAPNGAHVSAAGVITWTPDESQGPGTNTITTRVMDSGSPSMSATNSFTVVVNEVNVAPVLPVIANTNINELTTLTVTNTATDHDIPANPLTYMLVQAPANAVIDANGIITWTPTEAQGPSTNTFTTVVTDTNMFAVNAKSLSATNTFTVVVYEVNVAPVLTLPANTTINELTLYTNNATATDADIPANTLTFAIVAGPTNLTVSPSGAISWTPSEAQGPSTNVVQISVTDYNPWAVNAQHLSVTNSFSITVNEVNTAPVLGALSDWTVNPGQTISFTATATDSDIPTNTLTFSLIAPPAGASMDSSSGLFKWRPTVALAKTTNTVQVQVTDYNPYAVSSQHLSDTKSFKVVVNPLAPVVLMPVNYTNSQLKFQVSGTVGPDYIIAASTNLSTWIDIFTNLSPSTPFLFTNNATFQNRFYRARLSP